ncbi:MAG: tRNA lysidine(34) synthetase TilS [Bacteroidota bacterium]
MVDRLLAFINDQRLFGIDDKLLLAVSGGVDSMVLVHMLEQLKFKFTIAHCNFSLRGNESDGDEQFVSRYCASRSIEFYSKTFNTKKYAIEKGISTQMAARELRYAWFNSIRDNRGLTYILTAHHLNDSFETAIFNLSKGTGLPGLKGIVAKKGVIIRPLLFLTKLEIEEYATTHNLKWREDVSNESTKYHRNLIRHKIIPQLRKINPLLEKTFVNTSRRLAESDEAVYTLVEQLKDKYTTQKGRDIWIDKKAIINAVVLHKLLEVYGFNYSQCIEIKNSENHVGSIFTTRAHQLNVDREYLIVSLVEEYESEIQINSDELEVSASHFKLQLTNTPYDSDRVLINQNASLDLSKLKFPLKIRRWKQGDKFTPLGMKGKKKVSDFMIDAKIPLNLKSRVYVLLSGDEIAWVVGHRISDHFKVTGKTKMMYNITVKDYDKSL